MTAVAIDTSPAANPARRGPVPARTNGHGPVPGGGPAGPERPVLAALTAAESGRWFAVAQKTGFGLVSPLRVSGPRCTWTPPSLSRSASRPTRRTRCAWLARDRMISGGPAGSQNGRRSFVPGMAGQVAYHMVAQAGRAQASWAITTVVSCLPILVLAMGTALAHMLRADVEATIRRAAGPDSQPSCGPCPGPRTTRWDQCADGPMRTGTRPRARTRTVAVQDHDTAMGSRDLGPRPAVPQVDQVRAVARRLAATGKPVSLRALRGGGVTGSNEALNALARMLSAELTESAGSGLSTRRQAGLPATRDSIWSIHGGAAGIPGCRLPDFPLTALWSWRGRARTGGRPAAVSSPGRRWRAGRSRGGHSGRLPVG